MIRSIFTVLVLLCMFLSAGAANPPGGEDRYSEKIRAGQRGKSCIPLYPAMENSGASAQRIQALSSLLRMAGPVS